MDDTRIATTSSAADALLRACAGALQTMSGEQRAELERTLAWEGRRVEDGVGGRLGRVDAVLVDRELGLAQWLLLRLGPTIDVRTAVPVDGAAEVGQVVTLPWSRDEVRGARRLRNAVLSARVEGELCRYWKRPATRGARLARWERRATATAAVRGERAIVWIPAPRGQAVA